VSEKPIIFSAPMVRAIIDGRKTMTRRVVKRNCSGRTELHGKQWHIEDPNAVLACPYGQPGDKLWVRESGKITAKGFTGENGERWSYGDGTCKIKETGQVIGNHVAFGSNWKSTPSIHMPRWASRITLEVTAARVERLQEITEDDARAEGCEREWRQATHPCHTSRQPFAELWDRINAERGFGWSVNPFVWVVSFKLQEARNDR
jgi:hypothetical protein